MFVVNGSTLADAKCLPHHEISDQNMEEETIKGRNMT
jgi:hypothetical protein